MYKLCTTCCVVLIYALGYWSANGITFRQEQAKILVQNPKYIKDVVVFTSRKTRHDRYLTNMTGTLLMPYGNNVTFVITLSLASGGDFRIAAKVCDTMNTKWMNDFLDLYTNLTHKKCPVPAGRYRYMNMELPPKGIPIPMVNGDYRIHFELVTTATKEKIIDVMTLLHYEQNQKARKG